MRKDTDFIYEAITKLEELSGLQMEFDSSRPNYDGLVQIDNQEFLVEAKSAVRTSNLGLIITQLEQANKNSRRPIILVSKYVVKAAVKEFKLRNINFIDSAGNAFIKYGQIFIYIEGQKALSQEKTNQSRAFQEAGLKIIFKLLSFSGSLELSYRGLAESADVSIGSLSNVMKELEQLNYILKTKNRKILKNQEDLLKRWVIAYNEVLRPRLFRKRMKFIQTEQNKNWILITNLEISKPVYWGGEPGATLLGANLRPEKFTIYTNAELPELSKAYKLVPDADGNVEILSQFWTAENGQKNIAPPLLIYTDLINSGSGRNVEVAEHILKDDLQNIK